MWAPSIVRKPGGITYYMFYTGVELDTVTITPLVTTEIQRVGVATSVDLETWTQDATPVYSNKKAPWTHQDSTWNMVNLGNGTYYSDAWQFRDPFVMSDPEHNGRWLMYFAAIDSNLGKYVVGVAATPDTNLRVWQNKWPLRRTSAAFMNADRNESPHAFYRRGNWWLMYTSNHYWGDQITYALNGASPVDSATWSHPDSLKAITCGEHGFPTSLNQWHATEYFAAGPYEYLSAFADNLFGGGVIQFTQVELPDGTCPSDSLRLVCPDVSWAGVVPALVVATAEPVTLQLAGANPARSAATLRLVLRSPMNVHVAVYDVFGRRLKTLVEGQLRAGATTLSWDTHSDDGSLACSGIYFVRATCRGGRRVVKLPLLR